MLNEEQRSKVIKLFSSGMNISEISRKVGISRPSVYRVIASDIEKDAEIHNLEKRLRKTELQMKIRELREPVIRKSETDDLKEAIDNLKETVFRLMPTVLALCHTNPVLKKRPRWCFYCGAELRYYEKEDRGEIVGCGYVCDRCRKDFPFP